MGLSETVETVRAGIKLRGSLFTDVRSAASDCHIQVRKIIVQTKYPQVMTNIAMGNGP